MNDELPHLELETTETQFPPLLTPARVEHVFQHSFRFTAAAPMEQQFIRLLDWFSDLAEEWGTEAWMIVEPDGDACDSGHWVRIDVHGDIWTFDLSPWPLALGGWIPEDVKAAFVADGWVLASTGVDPQPNRSSADSVIEEADFVPQLRLLADRTEITKSTFLATFIHDVAMLFDVSPDRWFLIPFVRSPLHSRLNAIPRDDHDEGDDWAPDLFGILPPGWIERAVWPSGTEAAFITCSLGFHELHEPPCFES